MHAGHNSMRKTGITTFSIKPPHMKTKILLWAIITLPGYQTFAQSKTTGDFGTPILADSSSSIMIPTVYDVSLFTSNKLALWGDYYSNIIFYNFKTDSSKKLFPNDTYILSLKKVDYSYYEGRKIQKSITARRVFYRVMNVDRNKNNKIDEHDPVILYVSDTHGNNLKPLTSDNENVVDFQLYENQNIALVKVQRDTSNDGNFSNKDNGFYYVKLDLETLMFGNKIELH